MSSPSKLPTTGLRCEDFVSGYRRGGFSLIELLVATVILSFILVLVLSITDQTSKIWKHSTAEIQAFQSARAAYATMTQRLSQATLNTYLDYYDGSNPPAARTPGSATTFVPKYYARNSNLQFVIDQDATLVPGTATLHPGHAVFFQAPIGFVLDSTDYGGLPNVLNACGYYAEFNTNKPYLPPFLSGSAVVRERYRYRLMEFLQPGENNSIYNTSGTTSGPLPAYDNWFYNFLPNNANTSVTQATAPLRVLADNIIALAILPELSPHDQATQTNLVNSTYTYDSRAGDIINNKLTHHQLPPLLRVIMVAIDEPSAEHLNPAGSTTPPTLISNLTFFKTTASPDPNTDLNADLTLLTQALSSKKINYRVFDNDIAIRGAKWSIQQ